MTGLGQRKEDAERQCAARDAAETQSGSFQAAVRKEVKEQKHGPKTPPLAPKLFAERRGSTPLLTCPVRDSPAAWLFSSASGQCHRPRVRGQVSRGLFLRKLSEHITSLPLIRSQFTMVRHPKRTPLLHTPIVVINL